MEDPICPYFCIRPYAEIVSTINMLIFFLYMVYWDKTLQDICPSRIASKGTYKGH